MRILPDLAFSYRDFLQKTSKALAKLRIFYMKRKSNVARNWVRADIYIYMYDMIMIEQTKRYVRARTYCSLFGAIRELDVR